MHNNYIYIYIFIHAVYTTYTVVVPWALNTQSSLARRQAPSPRPCSASVVPVGTRPCGRPLKVTIVWEGPGGPSFRKTYKLVGINIFQLFSGRIYSQFYRQSKGKDDDQPHLV